MRRCCAASRQPRLAMWYLQVPAVLQFCQLHLAVMWHMRWCPVLIAWAATAVHITPIIGATQVCKAASLSLHEQAHAWASTKSAGLLQLCQQMQCQSYGHTALALVTSGCECWRLGCMGTLKQADGGGGSGRLLCFNPGKRLTAEEALRHPYVAQFHNADDEPSAASPIQIPIDDNTKVSPACAVPAHLQCPWPQHAPTESRVQAGAQQQPLSCVP